MPKLKEVEAAHKASLKRGKPQLNWCDRAVEVMITGHVELNVKYCTYSLSSLTQNWSPRGCEKLGKCIKPPKSDLKRCFWPH